MPGYGYGQRGSADWTLVYTVTLEPFDECVDDANLWVVLVMVV